MSVIDMDPETLRKFAESAIHSGSEAWIHMRAEFAGDIDGLMETLVQPGPYAYTIIPQVLPDGSVKSPLISTFDEIRECYKFVRGRSDLLRVEPLVEINGGWYNFQENLSYGRVKATGEESAAGNATLGLFPVSTGKGITGELIWVKIPRARMGVGPDPVEPPLEGSAGRRHLLLLHDEYLNALRSNDIDAMLATMNDGVQANIRNYVDDTGALIAIESKDDYRAYLAAFFAKYEVQRVDYLHRATEDWYLFAELRIEMRGRDGAGEVIAFNTADFFIPAKDNRFIVQIGHGTDLTH
jgi:hypothetical protein